MIDTIHFQGDNYPAFQSKGNAARFIMPFAQEVCKGFGVDIGCNRADWSLPGSLLVDPQIEDCKFNAHDLPPMDFDYIFSSHCLEHVPNWVAALDHWYTRLKPGGTLFLYLPDYSQKYWRPWNNRKHVNVLTPEMLRDYLAAKGYIKIFVSGVDLYNSFAVMAEKPMY